MSHGHVDVPVWIILPFAVLLGSIAICPLIHKWHISHRWEENKWKAALGGLLTLIVVPWMLVNHHSDHVIKAAAEEYFPFITLMFTLYCISGNISVTGNLQAKPLTNLRFLLIGGAIASLVGTTGAAMLLIRPLLRTNRERAYKAHTVVYFILVVCNCGGCLLPIGDPPLFMGFLAGVPFAWTLKLFPSWLFMNLFLLGTYFAVDTFYYAKETIKDIERDKKQKKDLTYYGLWHLLGLAAVVGSIIGLNSFNLFPKEGEMQRLVPYREMAMLGVAAVCILMRNKESLKINDFTWGPLIEVGVLFFAIFQTMAPVLMLLGNFTDSFKLSSIEFFMITGALSAFLDNAPTYMVFFKVGLSSGGEALVIVNEGAISTANLRAISLGAVFCGALTYIGNGPNFMVRAIAEKDGVKMPSFFGYMLWSLAVMCPALIAMAAIFIVKTNFALFVGWGITGIIAIISIAVTIRFRRVRRAIECSRTSPVLEMEPA